MPDKRKHRGQNPEDAELFSKENLIVLKDAARDLNYLLSQDYNEVSALKLVGDRYKLKDRQRMALIRVCCSEASLVYRKEHELQVNDCLNKTIFIDGYNLLIALEAALSGGLLFIAKDGTVKDISGIHGSYKKVEETIPALKLIGNCLFTLNPAGVTWYLDAPVSNSGRLKTIMYEISRDTTWNWQVVLDNNPDKILAASDGLVISSDSWILDRCKAWFNFVPYLINKENLPVTIIRFV